MAKVLVNESSLADIADAIRTQKKSTDAYKPSEMANAILSIETFKEEQTKSLDITANGNYEIIPDSDKVISKAIVNVAVPLQYDKGYSDGFSEGKKDGYNEGYQASQDSIIYQEKTVDIAENGTAEVLPDEGKTLSKVTVNVNVPSGDNENQLHATLDGTLTEIDSPTTKVITYACRGLTKLTTVNLPNATSIGSYAFYGCSVLSSVNMPLAESLGQDAFYNCNDLMYISLPSLTNATSMAFRNCQSIETIDLEKLTNIPSNMFNGCRGLKALILRSPTVVTLANTNAFSTCYCILGTKNAGYNPTGEKIGFFYVPSALIEDYKSAENWSDDSLVTQFRAIEDYPEITGGAL